MVYPANESPLPNGIRGIVPVQNGRGRQIDGALTAIDAPLAAELQTAARLVTNTSGWHLPSRAGCSCGADQTAGATSSPTETVRSSGKARQRAPSCQGG